MQSNILDTPVTELQISVRMAKALENAGITHIRDLVVKTEEEVRAWPNVSRQNLKELAGELQKMGLRLGMTEEDLKELKPQQSNCTTYTVDVLEPRVMLELLAVSNMDKPAKVPVTDKHNMLRGTLEVCIDLEALFAKGDIPVFVSFDGKMVPGTIEYNFGGGGKTRKISFRTCQF